MGDAVDLVLEQWKRERPDLDAFPMGVVGRIGRANQLLGRRLREHFAAHNLQPWEFDILATLRRSGAPYCLTPGALIETSMVTAGAITNRIDRLVARDLVTRETDPTNRRSVLIILTDHGRGLVDDAVATHVDNEAGLLEALTLDEQHHLSQLLRRLLISLGDGAPTPSP